MRKYGSPEKIIRVVRPECVPAQPEQPITPVTAGKDERNEERLKKIIEETKRD